MDTGRELAELYHREDHLSAAELAYAADLIESAGGRIWTREQADEYLDRALSSLDGVGLEG